jgi:regulator of sigma E protease
VGFLTSSILSGIREKHYFLGFNPGFVTFRVMQVRITIGVYIPIVGLSKIHAVVDGEKQRMRYPWEMDGHSIFKRIVPTFGGAVAMLLAGVLIAIAATYSREEVFISKQEANRHGIYPSAWAKEMGFRRGDQVIAINGKDYTDFNELIGPNVVLAPETSYTVLRDGRETKILITRAPDSVIKTNPYFIALLAPFEVSVVSKGSPAEIAGIQQGDRIRKVNGTSITKFDEMSDIFKADDDGLVSLQIERRTQDSAVMIDTDVKLDYQARLGILPRELITYTPRQNSFGQAIIKGPSRAFASVALQIRAFTRLVAGSNDPRQSLSGPIGISQSLTLSFWLATAVSGIWYAFYNLLPLPKSAFWEVIPLAYEGIASRKFSYTTFSKITDLGWFVIIAFIGWVLFSDIAKIISM